MKKVILIYLLFVLQLFCNAQVTDIDGNTYNTMIFGNQKWMVENLYTTHFNNGDIIDFALAQSAVTSWPAEGISVQNGPYMSYNIASFTNNLCPIGWHIPNTNEWKLLESNLDNNNFDEYFKYQGITWEFLIYPGGGSAHGIDSKNTWACSDGEKLYTFSDYFPDTTIRRNIPYSVRCVKEYKFDVQLTASDTLICKGDTVKIQVTATGESPPFTYTWGTGEIGDTIITVIPQYTYRYQVTVRDSLNQFIDKKIIIAVSENPEADFTYTLNSLENSGEFLNTTKEIRLNMETFIENSYEWQFEETQPKISQSSSNASKPISYIFPGFEEYYVTLWATNTYGCSDSITKIINTTEFPYISVPSAFSPNNDGLNDVLYAVGRNIENITFIIYDRWGQKVFESNSLSNGWDGTFNGKPLEAAVYMYYISGIATYDEKKIEKKGDITIIK